MPTLHEIPGASERPADCRIRLAVEDDTATIDIPPPAAPPVAAAAVGLAVCLLLTFYMGAMLFFSGRSVLLMTQISPNGLPVPLRPFVFWLTLGWLFLEGLGLLSLVAILRPLMTRERWTFEPQDIIHERRFLGRVRRRLVPRENVQGFLLRRDPEGFAAGTLTLRAGREKIVVAEQVREDEREWLASVGNALLRG